MYNIKLCYIFQMSNCFFLFGTKKWVYQYNKQKSKQIITYRTY